MVGPEMQRQCAFKRAVKVCEEESSGKVIHKRILANPSNYCCRGEDFGTLRTILVSIAFEVDISSRHLDFSTVEGYCTSML